MIRHAATQDKHGIAAKDMFPEHSQQLSSAITSQRESNQLLAAVPFNDWRFMESHLEWVEMLAGTTLHTSGAVLRHVYFPTTAVVSMVSKTLDGSTVEIAAVGPEGMVGVDAFMAGGYASGGTAASGAVIAQNTAVVMRSGHGYRMSAQSFAGQAKRSEQLVHHLLNYARTLLSQMSQTSACNHHHPLEQKLARWLLVHLDRQADDELQMTQERVASMLGVDRETLATGAARLQKAGVIRYARGQIHVLDRAGLQAFSCGCDEVVRKAYARLTEGAPMQVNPEGSIQPKPLSHDQSGNADSSALRQTVDTPGHATRG